MPYLFNLYLIHCLNCSALISAAGDRWFVRTVAAYIQRLGKSHSAGVFLAATSTSPRLSSVSVLVFLVVVSFLGFQSDGTLLALKAPRTRFAKDTRAFVL